MSFFNIENVAVKPCTINQKFIISRHTGRLILSDRYRDSKLNLSVIFRTYKTNEPEAFHKYKVDIKIANKKGDIDNYIKILLDALEEGDIILNDNQVREVKVIKTKLSIGEFSLKIDLIT